ncbi:MAG TPA: MG2 domain-containing protein [Gemmatimonadaceae bacterium]
MLRSTIAVLRFAVLAVASAAPVFAQTTTTKQTAPPPLRVIRSSPDGDGTPLSRVMITFDRPVAGSLDNLIDPSTLVRVEPAIPGKIEWRDPVTIRLTPSRPLPAGTTYRVTVANTFRSMDGGTLATPFQFSFRIQGPTLQSGTPVGPGGKAEQLTPNQHFELVYSAPVDLEKVSAAAYLEFNAACSATRVIHLRAQSQHPMPPQPVEYDEDAGPDGMSNPALDSLRRGVLLVPESPLPYGCSGELVAPAEIGDATRGLQRMAVSTYGEFRIAKIECNGEQPCPYGPFFVTFTTPVRGDMIARTVLLTPDAKGTVRDTSREATQWMIEAKYRPRVVYAVSFDTALRDVFGQRLRGNPAIAYRTTGVKALVDYAFGRITIERQGYQTLSVQHINVDSLHVQVAPIPDSLESKMAQRFAWADDSLWKTLAARTTTQHLKVASPQDRAVHTGVKLPLADARRAGAPTFFAVSVLGKSNGGDPARGPTTLAQITNLGVHVHLGEADGAVWVTGLSDGLPRANANVVLYDDKGKPIASSLTDATGVALLRGWPTMTPIVNRGPQERSRADARYVKVTLGDDRAIAFVSDYDPDLSPWRFNISGASGEERLQVSAGVFTERGIYRPGERVYSKAIVRTGLLGALKIPSSTDSLRWRFLDREDNASRSATVSLTSFGTSAQSFAVPSTAGVGQYGIAIEVKRDGKWQRVGYTSYRVAEYRPPEFLVNATSPGDVHFPGDTLSVTVQSRYLFGAPMGRAVVGWLARMAPISSWELNIPGTDGWYVGAEENWWDDRGEESNEIGSGKDTLDVRGERTLRIPVPASSNGRAANLVVSTVVTDVNRQNVLATTSTVVHPADFYIAVKPRGTTYFWTAGSQQTVDVVTVRPTGARVANIAVRGTVVRREWHQVRRERDGVTDLVGDWVSDTVATCALTTSNDVVPCSFDVKSGGEYTVTFRASDGKGRAATTSFGRWASGSDFVPWNDETQFKMDVIPDKTRYSVGDTASVLFASPFTNAEAWITVEREGIIEQRRIRITSGSTTLKFPITEAFAPNAYVSILVARGRSAKPGPLDDPGRPTIRVGYANLRVTPEVKRLTVTLAGDRKEYQPGDSATIRIQVRDARKVGARSEVTLWAVDEGVLSLTGYKTPDPIDLMYRERGLGVRLASNMTTVAPQVPDGMKGQREPGGGGGAAGADVLRSRFQTTAFFLGSVVTDAQGNGVARAKLPDNLTTFRVMAVAVTMTDRYGKGESPMLVTRPLLARQALPRFVRPGDRFEAGAVINRRDGSAATVNVRASASGITLNGDSSRTVTLAASRGVEVRFPFVAGRIDSATFRFDVNGGGYADAVRVSLPVRPEYHPRVHTLAGVVRDTTTVEMALPMDIDPVRSRLTVNVGVSTLPVVRGVADALEIYPYLCTEQVISSALPLIALYRGERQLGQKLLKRDARGDIVRAVEILSRRQRTDGGIGYWSESDWTSAWLSAYAGAVLLDARDLGIPVDPSVLMRLSSYLTADLHATAATNLSTPIARWQDMRQVRLRDQVASADFLSRFGHADVPAEDELYRMAALLSLEDRARLAEVFARRKQTTTARRLIEPVWTAVKVEGRRASVPDSARIDFYFSSAMRPVARILTSTIAVDPTNALIGPLVETLVTQARADARWNTQDYGAAVTALAAFERQRRSQPERAVRLTLRDGSVVAPGAKNESSVALTSLLADGADGRVLKAKVEAAPGEGVVYYYLSVTEVPSKQPVTPENAGIAVERWYEKYETGGPVTTVAEGDLVRVRLRITVPSLRQFIVLDDALPAGLEAIDLSLRTASALPGPGTKMQNEAADHEEQDETVRWSYGSWDSGWWSPFDHRELRDDRVVYSASLLWPGTYTATYLARATTPGTFIKPPAHAEEMYNPGLNGRSDGGTFVVTPRGK